jgi:hypothetical protein
MIIAVRELRVPMKDLYDERFTCRFAVLAVWLRLTFTQNPIDTMEKSLEFTKKMLALNTSA